VLGQNIGKETSSFQQLKELAVSSKKQLLNTYFTPTFLTKGDWSGQHRVTVPADLRVYL
jgi:hypothetical protein